jgi:5-methylcytosine-specific restriction endonuclease McrA
MSRPHIPVNVIRRVRAAAGGRCGYCRSSQRLVMAVFEVEHIIPVARGGTDDEENLWLSCPVCNGHKAAKTEGVDPVTRTAVPLFNPRTQRWTEHFRWSEDGLRVEGCRRRAGPR